MVHERSVADQASLAVPDPGFFGPSTELWRVLRERSVVMGGMRALLLHAAHPLVAAAASDSGMYEFQTWRRHERTLRLTFTLVFGSRSEASAAARQINDAHRSVEGVDRLTGHAYRARDHELLLWVHAALVSSFVDFERITIGRLDDSGRQRFHEEFGTMAGMLGLPERCIPRRLEDLSVWSGTIADSGILRANPSAQRLFAIVNRKASGAEGRRSQAAGFLALHTLPPQLRELYGIRHSASDERKVRTLGRAIRLVRHALPSGERHCGPAIAAYARMRGEAASIQDAAVLPMRWRTEPDAP